MIGRADIEGSKSKRRYERLAATSQSKGSLGHAFTVRIRTGNQNQTSFYPSVPHEISVLVELILGHLLGFPLSVPVLSWLFDARGRPPKEPFPVRPPAGTRRPALAAEAARAVRRQPTGSGLGPPVPSPQSQSFSRGYGSILPTSLAYIVPSTRGCSPWRPDAVMSTIRAWEALGPPDFQGPPGAHRTPRDVRCSSSRWTLPPTESFPGWAGC
ncbi:hypothetical protein L2E82_53330 [Cichorium intybus]|nr:hypothetical protein L2E82_53330 [Cichorium intybus]